MLQSTIAKEQAIATLNWIKETDEQSLRIGPRDILIDPVSNLLDSELYRKADEANRSSMFGAPTSVIYNGKLVQWRLTHSDYTQLLDDNHKPGTFQPKLETTELEFWVFDKWQAVEANEGLPGSEHTLLEPSADAEGTKITLVQERLSPWVLHGLRRYSATHQALGSKEEPTTKYESWNDAVQSILNLVGIKHPQQD